MTFDEVLDQVRELLQQRGRVTYRSLKRRFGLDDEYVEDLKGELIRAEGVAVDEDGDVLVWVYKEKGQETEQRSSGEAGQEQRASSDARPQTQGPRPPEGERRQLTVAFIDLVGSTTLSQQLDPEDYHARVVAYQTACRQVIARYEGHVAQYLGDGVLVYFGYPTAHEEDAVRAVRSGLEIVTAVNQLAYTPPLQMRIGIHTGPVVVGEIGAGEHTERLALGETPNIAARVQGQAEPDTVVISAATYHLIEGLFECEDYGQPTLKGVALPLRLYRVLKAGDAQSRFQVVVRKGLTPLVGREHEYGLLRERWQQVKGGTDALAVPKREPTMNLGWTERDNILHEFGHVLGLIEEHQNPRANIKWNVQAVKADLKGPPNFWSEAEIQEKVFKKIPQNQVGDYRDFDPLSIRGV